ncbi:MAG: outer membrane protein assembly factor BamD [Deltaproteobacteria bacterium]
MGKGRLIAILLFLIPQNAPSQSTNQIRSFADSLFREEDYYRAITEYKRFIFLYPKHSQSDETKFLIGFSYLKGEKWDAALRYFSAFSEKESRFSEKAEFLIGQTHFLANRHPTARTQWQEFLEKYPKSRLIDAAHYQRGFSFFLEEELERSREAFKKVTAIASKEHAGKMIEEIDRWGDHPSRSPLLAGIMSAIFPGSGQWYTGRFWDGLSALVINGIFIYGIYASFDAELYAAGGILAFFGTGFYGGNIFSAVSGAYKFNRNIKESQRQRLKSQHRLNLEWSGSSLTLYF